MKRNIIIDCDPGIDDTIAITFAIANEEKLNILGITTVTGNQSIEKVTNNALRLVSFLNRSIKVAKGSDIPLVREKELASDIHGATGMGNYELPLSKEKLQEKNAVEFLHDSILESEQKVTLVPIGPLTNIALLLRVYPEVLNNIEQIVLMGGAINGGNVTPTAEFNIWADPEAAKIVFSSGVKIVMNSLDVTYNTGLFKDDVNMMLKNSGRVTNMCGEILNFYFDKEYIKEASFLPIHDASAIMYLLHPEIFTFRHMRIDIDCSEVVNRGMTIADNREWIKYDESHPKVLMSVDTEKFREYLLKSLNKLDKEVRNYE